VRQPVVLAKALASLAVLHGGPVIAGLGPGSSRADYAAVGIPFEERWSRFDAATRIVRSLLAGEDPRALGLVEGIDNHFAPLTAVAPQIWVASWGSQLRLRAVAAAADGWIASGYNTDPAQYARSRARLDAELERVGRDPAAVPDMIATMWLYVTDDVAAASALVEEVLAPALNRDPAALARWLPIGTAEHCAEVLTGYAQAGARRVLLWPVRDVIRQLQLFGERVAPHIPD